MSLILFSILYPDIALDIGERGCASSRVGCFHSLPPLWGEDWGER